MRKALCTAIAVTLVLTACASGGGKRMFSEAEPRTQGYTLSAFVAPPNPTAPNVFIVDGKILVDQEPIYPPPGDQVAIYFGLEQSGSYEFWSNGIEIQGNPSFCAPLTQYVVKCSYRRPAAGTVYKYKVRVRPVGGGQPLKDLDPSIMN